MSRRRAFDGALSQAEQAQAQATPPGLSQAAPTFTPTAQPDSTRSQSTNKGQATKPRKQQPPSVTPPESQVVTQPMEAPAILPAAPNTDEDGDVMPPEIDDRHQCFICAEQIQYWAQGACGHMTCHICALRLRIFYKKNDCTFCKTVLPSLCFSSTPDAAFPSESLLPPPAEPGTLDLAKFEHTDAKLGVVFETEDMMETTLLLLRFNCPYPECAHMAASWDGLEKHTASVHSLVLCGLCRRQLSRFAHEQVLYPPHLLALHDPSRLSRGQRPPRPRGKKEEEMVAGWGAPHPMCEFCHEAFFSPDELFKHMRNRHEECFVCKAAGQRDVYFRNYSQMETHFNQAHYPCTQPACLEKKFVVFGSAMDLSGHMVSEHGDTMSAKDRAQARQIQIEFSGTPTPAESSRRANGGRGQGADALSRGPMHQQIRHDTGFTPAQEAQQRRQIQNDRRAAFGSNLTGDEPQNGQRSGVNSGTATPRENVDDATAERHNALITRVSFIVNHSENKLSSFRSAVRQFRNNESGPKDMIDTIFNVFDRDADSTGGVVKEIANLFKDDQEKMQHVLAALNAFKIEQRNQFPSLGSAPEAVGSGYADVSSGRVLSAKRATQNRGGSSRQVWDRVEQAAASHPANRPAGAIMAAQASRRNVPGALPPAAAFPALGSSSSILPKGQSPTPWAKSGASRGTAPEPVIRSENFQVASSSKAKPPSQSAFPSLPNASTSGRMSAAERKTLLSGPNVREETINRIRGTVNPAPVSGWGRVASGVGNLTVSEPTPSEQPQQVRSNKKGKKKELLFAFSATH